MFVARCLPVSGFHAARIHALDQQVGKYIPNTAKSATENVKPAMFYASGSLGHAGDGGYFSVQ